MISLGVKHNIAETVRLLDRKFAKQVPFAIAKTLTQVAKMGQDAVQKEMEAQFDRPTPYTIKSLYVSPATKKNLQARIYLKGSPLGGGNPYSLAEIIGQQYAGGTRIRKRIETALTRSGLISESEYVAPGQAATLDKYGNMSRGQVVQILSQIKAGIDPLSYKSGSSRSKASVKKAGAMFWSRGGKLPRGVWMRDGTGVKPILIVISKPQYRQRINIERTVQRVVDTKFDALFQRNLDDAIRTAF